MTGSSPELCDCSTFAIGRCTVCTRPICGTHSGLRNDKRLCNEHVKAFDDSKADAAHAAEVERQNAGHLVIVKRFIAGLKRIGDADDRFFATCVVRHQIPIIPQTESLIRQIEYEPLDVFASAGHPDDWTWDTATVVRWFSKAAARQRLSAPTIEVREHRPGLLGGKRTVTVARTTGWQIDELRVTSEGSGPYGSGGSTSTFGIYLLTTGELAKVGADRRTIPWAKHPYAHLSLGHGEQLLKAVGVKLPT